MTRLYPLGCNKAVDLVFLVDASGSVGPKHFAVMLSFLQTTVSYFHIAPHGTRVGIATFSDTPIIYINLNDHINKSTLMADIGNITYVHGSTNTDLAIRTMYTAMFTRQAGERPNVPNLAVVITDGQSNYPNRTANAAAVAKNKGIVMFAVGIGSHVNEKEMNAISNHPRDKYQLNIESFDKLMNAHTSQKLVNMICQGIYCGLLYSLYYFVWLRITDKGSVPEMRK